MQEKVGWPLVGLVYLTNKCPALKFFKFLLLFLLTDGDDYHLMFKVSCVPAKKINFGGQRSLVKISQFTIKYCVHLGKLCNLFTLILSHLLTEIDP